MNAIVSQRRIDDYLDVTRNARYQRTEYDDAVADSMQIEIDTILEDKGSPQGRTLSFECEQVISDKLYTIQAVQTAAPTNDIALFPSDYFFLTSMFATIGGIKQYVRPTTQNKLGPLLEDSFRAPSDIKPYYLQGSTGFKIYHGSGTITTVELNYLKIPVKFTIGKESQILSAGVTLTNGLSYIALENSVQNSVSYQMGDAFVAVGTTLTSGSAILTSNTTPIILPERTQQAICKRASEILSGNVQDYNRSAFAEKQAAKS